MIKKKIIVISCGIFVAVALVAMLLFVFSGDNTLEGSESQAVKIDGTWKVVAYIQTGNVQVLDCEYFVFNDDNVAAYRDGETMPYVTSSYELIATSYPNAELNLEDISRKYTVSAITGNYIRLYENSSVYMELIRYANDDLSDLDFSHDVVEGRWDVEYRNTAEIITEEIIHFEDGILKDYRNGGLEPVASVPYYWNENGCICVDALGVEMRCYPLSTDVLFFVEACTGYVWELHSAK